MSISNYRDLYVWQKSMDVVELVYILVRKLPNDEAYALSHQMRRAAISIPSNIAEGQARNSTKEFVHFLSIANGSKAELETQLLLCVKIGYLVVTDITVVMQQLNEISKMIKAISKSLITSH